MFRFAVAPAALALAAAVVLAQPDPPPIPRAAGTGPQARPSKAVPDVAAKNLPAVPAALKVKVGRPVIIEVPAKTTGFEPVFDPERCRLVRLYSDDPDVMILELWPFEAGVYPVVFWTIGEKRGVITTVTAGDPLPGPPGPPPPPKVNPYREKLRAAFNGDPGDEAAKNTVRIRLVELYSMGATLAKDPTVMTTDVLRERLKRAALKLTIDDQGNELAQLTSLRIAIGNELAPILPLGQDMTAARRIESEAALRLISEALAW